MLILIFVAGVIYFDLESLFKKWSAEIAPTSIYYLLFVLSFFVPKMLVVDWINTPSQTGCYHRSHKAGECVNRHSHSRVTDGVFRAVGGWGWREPGTAEELYVRSSPSQMRNGSWQYTFWLCVLTSPGTNWKPTTMWFRFPVWQSFPT